MALDSAPQATERPGAGLTTPPGTSLEPRAVLELLMEHVPAYLFIKDDQYRIVAANRLFLSLYPEEIRDSVLGTTTVENYEPEQRSLFLEQDRLALEQGFTETTETIDFPDGEQRTLLTRKVGYSSDSGQRYVLGIATDVTDLQRTQQEAAQLGRLIDSSINEVYILSAESLEYRRANKSALNNLSYSLEELRKVSPTDVMPSISERELVSLLRGIRSGENKQSVLAAQHARRDGSRYHVELHIQLAQFDGEEVFVIRALDTTELVDHRHALARKNEELTEFAYRASHDLRAPMVSSGALLELAERRISEGRIAEATEFITKARESLSKIEPLANEIARLAKIDHAADQFEKVRPGDCVEAAIERLAVFAGFADVAIERDFRFEGTVRLDVSLFRTIAENLLSNAVKYRNRDGRSAKIVLTTERDEAGNFVLTCEDNGIGVPERFRSKLFKMFSRFHPRMAEGTGLGLYMVRRSAQRLGGDVTYADAAPGSRFRVTIPAGDP